MAAVIAAVVLNLSVKEFKLDEDTLTMSVEETHTVSYQIKPEKTAKETVKWKSSDENIAIVDEDGKITAKGSGNCTITAKAGEMTDSISLTVRDSLLKLYADIADESRCAISPDGL